nr:hypothetical transcript [Hymenolepis microstoma]
MGKAVVDAEECEAHWWCCRRGCVVCGVIGGVGVVDSGGGFVSGNCVVGCGGGSRSKATTIKPTYTSTTTIPLLIHFFHGPFHHPSHHQHHHHPAHNFPQLHSRMYPHCSPPTP